MKNVKSPRIIFIGGSNLSFGLNSKMIKDSLELNPINLGSHASIGLVYMLDNTLPFIQSGDIVVVVPEYQQFYGTVAYGENELLKTVLDVDPSRPIKLRKEQWLNCLKYAPKYSMSKFNPFEYFGRDNESNFYGVNAFNEYGDACKHWKLGQKQFESSPVISEPFNYAVINELYVFKQRLIEKGAVLLISYPGYQASSFEKNASQIVQIETELKKNGFFLLGTPERYKMPESMMFNTPYHLLKEGVDYRTNLLIEDIKNGLGNQDEFPSRI